MPSFPLSSLIVVIVAVAAAATFLFSKRLSHSSAWRATITPLASIMGSGFLVCAPLLYQHVGNYAALAMAGLLVIAYGIGSVIRFNIRYAEPYFGAQDLEGHEEAIEHWLHTGHLSAARRIVNKHLPDILEKASHLVLAVAYCVSVSYYLQLLASFALNHLPLQGTLLADSIVTAILLGIGAIGVFRGLKGIERVERVVVGLNLALILSLIAGLLYYNGTALAAGNWQLAPLPADQNGTHLLRMLMGLLIVVQGFETSRFLGSEHKAEERIRTMRWAQIISALTYIVFLGLMALVMGREHSGHADSGVTEIIALSGVVASVLPLMITLTAIGSQFSAATADDAGCAGLLQSFIKRNKGLRFEYAIVSAVSIALTWLTNIYEIISIASRAFAFYYMIQCIIALLVARQTKDLTARSVRMALFAALALLCGAVVIFGIPAG